MDPEEITTDGAPQTEETAPHRPVRPRKRTGLYAATVIFVVLAYFGIAPRVSQAHKLDQERDATNTADPLVGVIQLTPTATAMDITLPSNIQAIEETTINAQTSGYVRERLVDIGSKVKQGQLLAVIESPEVDQQYGESVAQAAKSVADLGGAQASSANLLAAISDAQSEEVRSEAVLMQVRANLLHNKAKETQSEAALSESRSNQASAKNQVEAATADLGRANAGLKIAKITLTRWQQLKQGDAVSGQDVNEKEADYEASQAQVNAAQAHVSSAQAAYQEATDAISSAQDEVSAAQADVQASAENVNAASASVASGKARVRAAQANYQASRSNIKAAQASVSSQDASVRRVQALQSFERITAPFSGVITARNVDVGDYVHASSNGSGASDPMNTVTTTGLFGLAQPDVLRVQVHLPEEYVPSIHAAQHAQISVSEYPNKTFPGSVFDLSGALDAESRTLLVEVRVPNPNDLLKPGMFAQVHFLGVAANKTVRIPANTLLFDTSGTRVETVTRDDTMHYVTVKLGRDLGDWIEVVNGLNGHERLIANPDDSLQEGEKVTVTKPST